MNFLVLYQGDVYKRQSIVAEPGGSCTHEIKNKGVVGTSSSPVLLGVCRWDFFCYEQQNSHRGGIVAGQFLGIFIFNS